MEDKKGIVNTIDSMFNNNDFLMSAASSTGKFDTRHLYYILTITLNYFLATRDSSTKFSVSEIEQAYRKLDAKDLTDEQIKNIIINGFLTHSFSAMERKYVERYGFDYLMKVPVEERKKIEQIYTNLRVLEEEVGKSRFMVFRKIENGTYIADHELFMAFPGTKTIYYSQNVPERFYLGPVGDYSFDYFPMIVGESQKDYFMRILKYRIETMTHNVNQEELVCLAEKVVEYYTKKGTCIAFIAIRDIIDKSISAVQYGMCGEDCLRNFCAVMSKYEKRVSRIFTNREKDIQEVMHSGNFVTLSSMIPRESLAFANFPNVYDLKQQYLESMGVSKGTLVHYKDCTTVTTMNDYPSAIKKYYKKI